MTKVNVNHSDDNGYYLPHHNVIKASSHTTKLRVVFDGSAPSTTEISLNDTLHTGPKLQEDLFCILIRFRSHQYVLTGDIEKMYWQFLVLPEDRKYQKILWRGSSGETETYQLNTATFGLSAAPYLAIRCLKQLAEDEGHRFPRAAQVFSSHYGGKLGVGAPFLINNADSLFAPSVRKSEGNDPRCQLVISHENRRRKPSSSAARYGLKTCIHPASNVKRRYTLTGAVTRDEALTLRTELTNLLQLAGLNIRKWASNDNNLLHGLSIEETNHQHFLGGSQTLKMLGVFWNSSDHSILYSVEVKPTPSRVTKRIISSEIAKIYDSLVPIELHTEWDRYYAQLPLLNNIRFQRKAIMKSATEIELHGFWDASEKAYGACVYLRTLNTNGRVWTQLLIAKSKVAPLKYQTIPWLELSAALLLTSLMSTVQRPIAQNYSNYLLDRFHYRPPLAQYITSHS
ncbi:uncharacterized protein LOC112212435 [Bombus impatiens]|uniref:Uncharacterized protein LOC112212435 n=1 Tax=Bombus impatiens TaxID=132113 RepID=A0A6P6F8C9_BOMIM|nr:uncharacterized protein LOC112212435 [Bombus impatiens]